MVSDLKWDNSINTIKEDDNMTSLDESEQLEYIVSLQRQLQDYKYGVVKNGRL